MIVRSRMTCAGCARETAHDVRYTMGRARSATCVACGMRTRLDGNAVTQYLDDVTRRMRSKPERVARELRRRPTRLLGLPRRIASKPSRLRNEILDIIR